MKKFLLLLFICALPLGGQFITSTPLSATVPGGFSQVYQNIPFSGTLKITGGSGSYICSLLSGSFPTGLSLTGCTVSGTPTGTTLGTTTIGIVDTIGNVFPNVTLTITPDTLSSIAVTPASPTVAAAATQQLICTGTWLSGQITNLTTLGAWTSGTPAKATVGAATGLVTGVASGTSAIQCAFNSITGNTTVTVTSGLAVATTAVPVVQYGIAYPPFTMTCTGGTGPYTWDFSSGSLPAGMTLSVGGVISGTTTATTLTPTFRCTDSLSATATSALAVTVVTVTSNAVVCVPASIVAGSSSQCTSTTTFSDSSTANTTAGSNLMRLERVGVSNATGSLITSLTTPPFNLRAGALLYVGARHGTDFSSAIACTDLAGNTFTAIGSLTNTSPSLGAAQALYAKNTTANVADTVTCTFGAPTAVAYDSVLVEEFSGADTSAPLDQHNEVADTSTKNSCISSAYTTTVTAEIIVQYCTAATQNSVFSAGGSFQLDGQDPDGMASLESLLVSSIQTAQTATTSFSLAPKATIGLTSTLKAAVTGVGAAWSSGTPANATVNGAGLVSGTQAGTSVISAIFGAQTGTATVTVTGGAITTITVTPNPGSGANGTSVQFGAVDQSGNNITNTVSWSSQTISCATINATGLATVVSSASCSSIIQASINGVNGTATLNGTGTAASLLFGCTVSATNVPSCGTPAGWTLAFAQGFDTGSVPPGTQLFGAIQAGGHTGSNAMIGTYNGGDQAVALIFPGSTINSREIYVSWWDMYEQPGRINTEMYLLRRELPGSIDFVFDWQPRGLTAPACNYNCVDGQMTFAAEGLGALPNFNDYSGGIRDPKWGQWVQYEAHIKANNPSFGNPPGGQFVAAYGTDSVLELFQNGSLIYRMVGRNINGVADMAGATLQIGGIVTYYVGYSDSARTTCLQAPDAGGPAPLNYTPWTTLNPCRASGQAPSTTYNGISNPAGYGPTFRRRIDDIIVLKK